MHHTIPPRQPLDAAKERSRVAYEGISELLNSRLFPHVVSYATNPYIILATMLLLIPLILDASNTSLSLVLGNYTNVVSASVSSIVLAKGIQHHKATNDAHKASVVNHARHAKELASMSRQNALLANYVDEMRREMGEIRRMVEAQQAQPKPSSPAKPARRARRKSQWDPNDPIEEE